MLPFSDKKYDLIYADPPWLYDNKLGDQAKWGAATSAYPCMSVAELSALPVQSLADPKACALVMWTTGPKQREAHEVMKAWGFRYVTIYYVWVKLRSKAGGYPIEYSDIYYGRGQYTRPNAEFAFLGIRGRVPTKYELGVPQVAHYPRSGPHSAKPELFRKGLDHMWGPCNKIELFARNKTVGWDCWGNEV